MEIGLILEAIATVGFPIVMVLALGYFIYKIWQQSVKREDALLAEITENRLVNQKFAEIIGQYEITLGEIKTDVKDIKETLHINNQ